MNRHVSQSTHRRNQSFALLRKRQRSVPNWSYAAISKVDAIGNSRLSLSQKQPSFQILRRFAQDAPSHFGSALMTATPSAFMGYAPGKQCLLQSQPHNCRQRERCRVGETDKAPERSDTLPFRESLCLVLQGRRAPSH